MVGGGLLEKVSFRQRPEEVREGATETWGVGPSLCEGPEAGLCPPCWGRPSGWNRVSEGKRGGGEGGGGVWARACRAWWAAEDLVLL